MITAFAVFRRHPLAIVSLHSEQSDAVNACYEGEAVRAVTTCRCHAHGPRIPHNAKTHHEMSDLVLPDCGVRRWREVEMVARDRWRPLGPCRYCDVEWDVFDFEARP